MAKCTIYGGACRIETIVEAKKENNRKISVKITTECKNLQNLSEHLQEINPYEEIPKRLKATRVCELATEFLPHPSCPVPSGILKTIEVEAGLALPQTATIKVEKD